MHSLEEKAQKALELIIALENAERDQFKQLVIGQIGKELLAVFRWHANAVPLDNPEEVVHDLVHLMLTAYLIKSDEMEPLFADKDIQEELRRTAKKLYVGNLDTP